MRLHALAPAKVNLCLFLGRSRSDGRHELVTLMEPLSLADELTLETIRGGPDTVICPGVDRPNLAGAALAALRSRGWEAPSVRITIDKRIPVAAGMGGGSSDAAATLRLAAELEPLPDGVAAEVAATLGSDVPGLVDRRAVLATGAGEVVEPVAELAPHAYAILPSPFGLSTADVYARADRMRLARSPEDLGGMGEALRAALSARAELPASLLVNDLQDAALALAPRIEDALVAVRAAGADHATVCGSGPTVAGLFWGATAREQAAAAVRMLLGGAPARSRPGRCRARTASEAEHICEVGHNLLGDEQHHDHISRRRLPRSPRACGVPRARRRPDGHRLPPPARAGRGAGPFDLRPGRAGRDRAAARRDRRGGVASGLLRPQVGATGSIERG